MLKIEPKSVSHVLHCAINITTITMEMLLEQPFEIPALSKCFEIDDLLAVESPLIKFKKLYFAIM